MSTSVFIEVLLLSVLGSYRAATPSSAYAFWLPRNVTTWPCSAATKRWKVRSGAGCVILVFGEFVAIKKLWTAARNRLSMSKRRLQHAGADSIQIQRYVGCAGFIPATESFPQFIAL